MQKLIVAIALLPLTLATPANAESIEETNGRFLQSIYERVGYDLSDPTFDALLVSEGLRYCLRRHQEWSEDKIRSDQVERIIYSELSTQEKDKATTIFASVNVSAQQVFCREFWQ